MKLEGLMSRRAGPWLAMSLSRLLPPRGAYHLARTLAGVVCRLRPEIYWVVRSNLRPVLGEEADDELLERTTRQVFSFAIRSYYDLYRTIRLSREEILAAVDMPPEARAVADQVLGSGRGVILAVVHLGNFDLLGQSLGSYTSSIQVVSLPDPPAGFQLLNDIRRRSGLDVTPLSPGALRQALRGLRAGGVVGIAVDRPVSELDEPFSFFGRPTRVPSAHIRLALKTDALLVLCYSAFDPKTQRHAIHLEPPLEVVRLPVPEEEIRVNMRRVLDQAEAAIRAWPEQWMIFVPVWPEALAAER